MLSNSVGILALFGLLFVTVSTSQLGDKDAGAGPIVWTSVSAQYSLFCML